MDTFNIKKAVRENYGAIVSKVKTSCCSCGCSGSSTATDASRAIGYSDEQMNAVPDGANLGLGCGNPTALASLKPGETVLDLGSGAGFDCFLAANQVGDTGHVIGVDMTQEMIDKARENAIKSGRSNVEFRLGEIEHLPVADNAIDAIISNCVINLAPDKAQVFREAYRVLKPGGRVMVSDIVLTKPMPEGMKNSIAAYVGCIAGAVPLDDYKKDMRNAGFTDIDIVKSSADQTRIWAEAYITDEMLDEFGITMDDALAFADSVLSASITAVK